MDEIIRQIIDIFRGMWRRRWIGVAAAWATALIGAVVVARIPERFEASARVYVDTASLLKPLLSGIAVQPDVDQQVSMLARTLITRPNVERLIRQAELDLGVKSDRERDALVDFLVKELRFTTGGRDNVFNVAFRSDDKEHALRIVQSLVSMFVESGLGNKRKDTDVARRFIDEQIRAYEKRLEEAENKLKDFRLRNLDNLSAGNQDFVARSGVAIEELNRARVELRVAEQSRDALKRELAGEEPILVPEWTAPTQPAVATELDSRIESQRRALDELLRRYTDQHPDVMATRRMIASLEDQRRQEQEARRKAATTTGRGSAANNPVFQQIKVALTEAEANVAALRQRAAELQMRVDQLRASATRVPAIEAELAQLNRDYEVIRQSYQQLVTRRESATLTGEVDETASLANFRVIDPPRVSDKAVFPNRVVLVFAALLAALGMGVGAALAASQLMPTFHSTRVLRQTTQRPVLGSVSLRPNPAMVRRDRRMLAAFTGATASLVVAYGAWLGWLVLAARG